LGLGVVVGRGLASAHASRLFHGGLNPWGIRFLEPLRGEELAQPIIYRNGRLFLGGIKPITPKIMDFGIPPMALSVRSTRKSYGTPDQEQGFQAPEQQTGLGSGAKSDMFTLAGLIHYCITSDPVQGKAKAFGRLGGMQVRASEKLPDAVANCLNKALKHSPADRYASTEEMSDAIEAALNYLAAHPQAAVLQGQAEPEAPRIPGDTPEKAPPPLAAGPPASPPAAPGGFPKAPARTPTQSDIEPEKSRTPEPPPHHPSPHRVVLPRIEPDPNWRPPLRASAREEDKKTPTSLTPRETAPPPPLPPPSVPSVPRVLTPPAPTRLPTPAPPPRLPRHVDPMYIIPEMVLINGQSYRMGSPEAEDEGPVHLCAVSPFYMAVHPVTNEEYKCFVLGKEHPPPRPASEQYAIWSGTKYPSGHARRPMVHISWNDAQAYCEWLSEMSGQRFRLPTEAEWECAARGGLEGQNYPWGDEDPVGRAVFDLLWTGPAVIPEAGSCPPNPYGLHDMAGLVWEWCRDYYHRRYYELPEATEPDPVNEAPSLHRVMRGGAWLTGARTLRCAHRGKHRPDSSTVGFGFRLVREV
jgi:formylglycine-generating enzyme required for sulfatase activity